MLVSSLFRTDRTGGINAGVMLLTPDKKEFAKMMVSLLQAARAGDFKSGMPEQDFLTSYYNEQWTAIGLEYNFQPHQIAHTDRKGLERCRRLAMSYPNDVRIVHFSALPKPVHLMIDDGLQKRFAGKFARTYFAEHLFQQYCRMIGTDRLTGKSTTKLHLFTIEGRLREATMLYCNEWFTAFDEMTRGWDLDMANLQVLEAKAKEERQRLNKAFPPRGERRFPRRQKRRRMENSRNASLQNSVRNSRRGKGGRKAKQRPKV